MGRKVRMGMVGGGVGSFIGGVHRIAARIDGQIELVCGAFSSNPEKSKQSGEALYLPADRVYGSYHEMIQKESQLPIGERMDLVSIVTPNHVHFEPAKLALENGFDVICDKPLCHNLDEAYDLVAIVDKTDRIFALTHTYTGYPMVKQAKEMIAHGDLGEIRKVVVNYPQGWLSERIETQNHKQASWRTDPAKSGIAGAMGDIGTHAENLAEYITGLHITAVAADVGAMVEGRRLDDDGSVLLRFNNGAKGVLQISQVATGIENALNIQVYGTKASIEWHQMQPNSLTAYYLNDVTQVYRSSSVGLYPLATQASRIPPGHPEGYLEAFANIYKNVATCIQSHWKNENPEPQYTDYPTVEDGLRGMEFIYKVIESSQQNGAWVELPK